MKKENIVIIGQIIFLAGSFVPFYQILGFEVSYFALVFGYLKSPNEEIYVLFPLFLSILTIVTALSKKLEYAFYAALLQLTLIASYLGYLFIETASTKQEIMKDSSALGGVFLQFFKISFKFGVLPLLVGPAISAYAAIQKSEKVRINFEDIKNINAQLIINKLKLNNVFSLLSYILLLILVMIIFNECG